MRRRKTCDQVKQEFCGRAVKSLLHLFLRVFVFYGVAQCRLQFSVPHLRADDFPSHSQSFAVARVRVFPATACSTALASAFPRFSTAPDSSHTLEACSIISVTLYWYEDLIFLLEPPCWHAFVCGGCGWSPLPALRSPRLAGVSVGMSSLQRVSKPNTCEIGI